jgi:hypothetical protein
MAFKIVDSVTTKLPHVSVPLSSTAVTKGSLLYADTTNKVAKVATSSAGSTTNILGVANQTVTSSATAVECTFLRDGTLVEADCTNNTATNQLLIQHVLTDGATVNNTSTHSTDVKAVFFAVAVKGAAADKKLLGYIIRVGSVTA